MSQGYAKNQHRKEALSLFVKDMIRRSKSHCELCEKSGAKLEIHEIPPIDEQPVFEHCVLICETCSHLLHAPQKANPLHWQCLNKSAWSDIPAVQVVAVRILKQLSKNEPWAKDLLEQLYIAPEIQEWIDQEE